MHRHLSVVNPLATCAPPVYTPTLYSLQVAESRRESSLSSYVQDQLEYSKLWKLLEFANKLDALLQVCGGGWVSHTGAWLNSHTPCGNSHNGCIAAAGEGGWD